MAYYWSLLSCTAWGITAVIFFLASLSATAHRNHRVVGGVNATAGEFPFAVSLQMIPAAGSRYHFCMGSILNATHVVVTAHCVVNRQLDQVQVVAGAYNLSSEEQSITQRRSILSATIHPNYNPDASPASLRNDTALVALNQSLQFNSNIQPMPLPPPNFSYMGNCTVIGWGSTLNNPPSTTDQLLQKLNMTIVPSQTCQSIYQYIHDDYDNATMICAKGSKDEKTEGPCTGDSGAPLLCKSTNENESPVVAGIVSWIKTPCGDSSYPTIFMNISTLSGIIGNF